MSEELVIGLVVEGPTDYEVIELFIRKALADKGFDGNIEFERKQPKLDQTSATYPGGGWTNVFAWCRRFSPADRQLYFTPLFEDEKPIDLLIVQLDGDVLADYAKRCQIPLPKEPWTAKKRGEYVEGVLREWLWPDSNPAKPEKGHITLASIIATETWLIAGFDKALKQPEEVDPKTELIRLRSDIPNGTKPRLKAGKLWKQPERWQKMASYIIDDLDGLGHIRSVCHYCNKFLSEVETAV